ncbi:hypothetical protein Trydic_g3054 [Trypoxylus dichotomus]
MNVACAIYRNKGVVNVYEEFLEEIQKKTGYIVWAIGHAGHNKSESYDMPSYVENQELYGLQGQIKHKIEFLEEYLPKNARITFIGHSVGSYIIVKLLAVSSIQSRVDRSFLLFPTIEYIGDSENAEEMLQIRERDNKIIMENVHRIKIYYGTKDGWCPLTNYHNIKKDIPNINAEVCDKGYPHAFIINDSLPMAALVTDWMNV